MDPVNTRWLSDEEMAAWKRLVAVLELLPGALDSQLRRDADLTHFDYYVLAMLSEAREKTLRMTLLAAQTSATLPRLSHVIRRLETRELVTRFPCPDDARATNVRLTDVGLQKVEATASGHVENVRHYVLDALTAEQITQLTLISDALLQRLDPSGAMASMYSKDRPATD